MVRMVAITASLEMSSQVGATAVRKMPAASANSSASRLQVAKRSQIRRSWISRAGPVAIAFNKLVMARRAPKATTNTAPHSMTSAT